MIIFWCAIFLLLVYVSFNLYGQNKQVKAKSRFDKEVEKYFKN